MTNSSKRKCRSKAKPVYSDNPKRQATKAIMRIVAGTDNPLLTPAQRRQRLEYFLSLLAQFNSDHDPDESNLGGQWIQ
jgi:hypothetical protein